jgi:hypothetical protein
VAYILKAGQKRVVAGLDNMMRGQRKSKKEDFDSNSDIAVMLVLKGILNLPPGVDAFTR